MRGLINGHLKLHRDLHHRDAGTTVTAADSKIVLADLPCARLVRDALAGNPTLLAIIDPLLAAWAALCDQLAMLEKRVRDAAR